MNQLQTGRTRIKVFSKGMEKRNWVQEKFKGKDLQDLAAERI